MTEISSSDGGRGSDVPLALLVSAVFDSFVQELHRRLPAAGFADIRPAHCTGVFRVLDPDGTRPGELARRAGITAQGMAELVRHLESHGYVERIPDPDDGRGRIVRLTKLGRQASAAATDAFVDIEDGWRKRLGAARTTDLHRLLTDLATSPQPDSGATDHTDGPRRT